MMGISFAQQGMDVDNGPARCTVDLIQAGPAVGQKFMGNGIADRVAFLETRMLSFSALLEEAEGCSAANSVNMPAQVLWDFCPHGAPTACA